MTKHLPESERRRQILDAARLVFIRNGFASTRVEDVAKEANLSKGAVYFYFPSKQALFLGVVLDDHDAAYALLDEIEQGDDPAMIKLLRIGLHYAQRFTAETSVDENPTSFFIMMCELATRDPELREECYGLHERIVGAITRILAQGIFEQQFREMDPHAVALLLKATIDGFASHKAIGATADEVALRTDGFSTILRGILRDPARADSLLASYGLLTAQEAP
jgi:AcrR family transcriptional regulator